jgi:hypothetical protein
MFPCKACFVSLTLALTAISFSAHSADSPLKSITISYITEYFVSHHLALGKCGKLLGMRPKDQTKLRQALELGKPYMTAKEIEQLKSGDLETYLHSSAQKGSDAVIAQAQRFLKNERDICHFAAGYVGGRQQAFRDQIENMGGPRL